MTITPEATTELLKAAARGAFDTWEDREIAAPGLDVEWVVDRVATAIRAEALPAILKGAIEKAMQNPAYQAELCRLVLVPLLTDLEDSVNDAHDDGTTPEIHRPGLRRAARLIRDTRRAATEEAEQA